MPFKNFVNWKETNEEDKIEYYSDRKHGIIEIFTRVRLPYKFYEVANALSIIHSLKSFDDYVSSLVYEDIENQIQNGPDIISDAILNKVTGKETYWHTAEEEEKDLSEILVSREEAERFGKIPEEDSKENLK